MRKIIWDHKACIQQYLQRVMNITGVFRMLKLSITVRTMSVFERECVRARVRFEKHWFLSASVFFTSSPPPPSSSSPPRNHFKLTPPHYATFHSIPFH